MRSLLVVAALSALLALAAASPAMGVVPSPNGDCTQNTWGPGTGDGPPPSLESLCHYLVDNVLNRNAADTANDAVKRALADR